jgi:xanthine/uracil permease
MLQAMSTAFTQARKLFQQDLRYYLPRWIAALVVVTLIEQLAVFPPTGRGLWYIPSLVLAGVLDGTFGGLVFVGLQRMWNPSDRRVVRLRNYFAAVMIVGVGSLLVAVAINR